MLGRQVAEELQYPDTIWRHTAPLLLRLMIFPMELCRRLVPWGTSLACWYGQKQIERLLRSELFARRPPGQTPSE
jgi:hypothetical protein